MRGFLRFALWLSLISIITIAALRVTVLRWWQVPEGDPYLEASIAPTLSGGDWVILWRGSEPGFGSLVLCPEPGHPERVVLGRIAGKAGDLVAVNGSILWLNHRAFQETENCLERTFSVNDPASGRATEQNCSMERLASTLHPRGNVPPDRPIAPVEARVRPGEVFLLSDNRLFSYDSRDFGTVPLSSCRESVIFRLIGRQGYFDSKARFSLIH